MDPPPVLLEAPQNCCNLYLEPFRAGAAGFHSVIGFHNEPSFDENFPGNTEFGPPRTAVPETDVSATQEPAEEVAVIIIRDVNAEELSSAGRNLIKVIA